MFMLKCDTSPGPMGYLSVGVYTGSRSEYFAIEARFLIQQGEDYFLPVRVISFDKKEKRYLAQLPVEADSGANRVWVNEGLLTPVPEEVVR